MVGAVRPATYALADHVGAECGGFGHSGTSRRTRPHRHNRNGASCQHAGRTGGLRQGRIQEVAADRCRLGIPRRIGMSSHHGCVRSWSDVKRFRRRDVLASTAVVLGIPGAPLRAQNAFPRGPIRLLVGFPAGGTADIAARLLAEKLRERTGVTVIVDNKPGAGGVIATEAVTKMAPDGNAIVLAAMVEKVWAN